MHPPFSKHWTRSSNVHAPKSSYWLLSWDVFRRSPELDTGNLCSASPSAKFEFLITYLTVALELFCAVSQMIRSMPVFAFALVHLRCNVVHFLHHHLIHYQDVSLSVHYCCAVLFSCLVKYPVFHNPVVPWSYMKTAASIWQSRVSPDLR